MKSTSIFYPERLSANIAHNAANYTWAADMRQRMIEEARFWMELPDDELWGLMFGPAIKRSWMVLSGGYCPACKQDVTMYNWVMDGKQHPWKTKCPHCGDLFPKNDFARYYHSGLDRQGMFQPEQADRSLLYNTEHPDPADPLHLFGVDDGDGYMDPQSGLRWRFIGAYLIYGHWKQLIVNGADKLANAYAATGNPAYARKAGILLDRIADVYPLFDFGEQGIMYEKKGHSGYVSTWHDANMETRQLVLAYDKIFTAIREDAELVAFLSRKAKEIGNENGKHTFAAIQTNIEERIFRDALANRPKIVFNFPGTDTLQILLKTVLDWPQAKPEIMEHMDQTIARAVAVDGVTGEKGLANYCALTINKFSEFMALYDRVDPSFMAEAYAKHPALKNTWRFHIDTWCLENYYPLSGDSGAFGLPVPIYRGVLFENIPRLDGISSHPKTDTVDPSMYAFMWNLYRYTGDTDYVKIMYKSSGGRLDRLPYDMTFEDPEGMQQELRQVIAREGEQLVQRSVNKEQWHLAILRSGQGASRRALWLDYDSGFTHGHSDGMNLGLFAKGLDLMPECGYPPVQFGEGWSGAKVKWYGSTASHNTVVVDGVNLKREVSGVTTLWADGETCKLIRVSGPALIEGKQYERTAVLTDLSQDDAYVVDVFRVVGGRDHAKFFHSHFGSVTAQGLELKPAEDYGNGTLMRHFHGAASVKPGWSVHWTVEDVYGTLPAESPAVHLRYTDLTQNAGAYISEGWVNAGGASVKREKWVPRVMTRRQTAGDEPLASTFVAVIEPYTGHSGISSIRRLKLHDDQGEPCGDADVAIELRLADGRRDLHLLLDAEDPLGRRQGPMIAVQKEWRVELEGEYAMIRMDGERIVSLLLARARSLKVGDRHITLHSLTEKLEIGFEDGVAQVRSGNPEAIVSMNF